MSDCTTYHILITCAQAGEIREDELLSLRGHCRTCPECASLLASHGQLEDMVNAAPDLTEAESLHLRRGVMSQLEPASAPSSFWHDLRAFLNLHPVAMAPVAVVALLAVFFLGRWSVPAGAENGDVLLTQLTQQAATRESLTDYLNNPLTYTNVSARPRGNRLALSFDVRRHVELETGMDSPLARDVLLASLLDDPSIGSRLRAIQLSPSLKDDSLREALVYTLQNDPDLAIRLEAVAALARYPDAPDTQDALLHTLREDPSVQMRMVALTHLNQRQVDPVIIRQAISTIELEGDAAVMQQALQWQRSKL